MGLAPNPSSGRVNLAFSLREPASVSFDVLDMAGRVVNRITSQRWEAGTWSVGWDGRRSQGTEAPPGIYFVQMRVDGRPIGLSRLALIR
ncbi:MAG: T9SS type A sorting domain-containing protein [Candidatus Eisenbacteria bacterium]|uniref:T9SS type A sorting domain-containing protein n=1 Tax=Eiseniibacteriota bacterium TaxID=2212470 RepID=A0A538TVN6_UNCEI|nr:MAG: T9SS type A sorting domain-containing protein [Candidatus Eisenbacteria bacterium]